MTGVPDDAMLVLGYANSGGYTAELYGTGATGPELLQKVASASARYEVGQANDQNQTWSVLHHPGGGAVLVGIDYCPDAAVPGWYLQSRRIYFKGDTLVREGPTAVKVRDGLDTIWAMADYLHLSKVNDNAGSTGYGYEIRRIDDLSLVRSGNHQADFGLAGTTGTTYSSPYWTLRNTFFVPVTKQGKLEWAMGMKIDDAGNATVFDLAGTPQASDSERSNYMNNDFSSRFVNKAQNWNPRDQYAVFYSGGGHYQDTKWDRRGHLVDEDGNVVELKWPYLDAAFNRTTPYNPSGFPAAPYAGAWTQPGDGTVGWWGWAGKASGDTTGYKFAGTITPPVGGTWSTMDVSVDYGWSPQVPADTIMIGGAAGTSSSPRLVYGRGNWAMFGYQVNYDYRAIHLAEHVSPFPVGPELEYWWQISGSNRVFNYVAACPYTPYAPSLGGPLGSNRAFLA